VSKQDSKFFNVFSLVLGILLVITLVLFALARSVGKNTQSAHLLSEPKYVASVESNIAAAKVAVAGQDNSALAIQPLAGVAAAVAAALPTDGAGVYDTVCGACHLNGIGGAPKSDDKAAWAPRIAQGTATLYKHAIEGYQGKNGYMPPKGGRTDLTDDLVKAAVDHMVAKAQ
jgi:cytochrome c5